MKYTNTCLGLFAATLFGSCASYVTPGRQADLSTFTDPRVKKAFEARPAIRFPATLAVVRVQESGYRSESAQGVGSGAYSVVTARDIETEEDIDTISSLRGVGGVVSLNRLLLPRSLTSDLDLREAAAKLQAEAILIYTIATEFSDNDMIAPLTTLTLGLAPNKRYKINSSASAILMDTKTGYIYGALEEGESRAGLTMAWGSRSAIDASRKKAERAAFDKLLASFPPFWARIYNRFHR
ncbi:hypothetical protein BH23VER1_BH23VER1_30490 [soil metagenome]